MTEKTPVCDFCHSWYPRWDYGCQNFTIATQFEKNSITDHVMSGGWLACSICATAIDDEEWVELGNRGLAYAAELHPSVPSEILLGLVTTAQDGFQENRTGEKVSFG